MKSEIRFISKIVDYCECIQDDVSYYGSDEEDFLNNLRFQHSSAFCLTQIGELVKHLSPELTAWFSEVQWKEIAGLRDVISHGYDEIKYHNIWITLVDSIPDLKFRCENIIYTLEHDD